MNQPVIAKKIEKPKTWQRAEFVEWEPIQTAKYKGLNNIKHTVPSPDVKGSAKHDVPLPHAVVTKAPLAHSANEAPAHDTSPSVLHVELAEASIEANCLLSF